jgi:hypothetical protein
MRWFGNSAIVLDITPERVTFTEMDGEPVSLAPFIHVAPNGGRTRILAAGVSTSSSGIRVALFSSEAAPAGISKLECLTALFKAGLKAIVDRSLLRVKPEVLVRGAESVSRVLGGYERDLITAALGQAGARRVRWPEEFVPE